jgi:hypothetical protein
VVPDGGAHSDDGSDQHDVAGHTRL